MKLLICGGRNYADRGALESAISQLPPITMIIQGGAKGADTLDRRYG